MKQPFRIGFGVDLHRLEDGQELVLGGIKIPGEVSAIGHSDADTLLHAITDAILGAVNLRDIGFHFSDTDPQYKGIDSKLLLKKAVQLVHEKGYHIGNIDATVILEAPKVNPHVEKMQAAIAPILKVNTEDISIKATTNEKLGYLGSGDGVRAYAIALLFKA